MLFILNLIIHFGSRTTALLFIVMMILSDCKKPESNTVTTNITFFNNSDTSARVRMFKNEVQVKYFQVIPRGGVNFIGANDDVGVNPELYFNSDSAVIQMGNKFCRYTKQISATSKSLLSGNDYQYSQTSSSSETYKYTINQEHIDSAK